MPKFLIEVPHEEELVACAKAVKVFLSTGSHFLSHAEWGCGDGEHKAWIIVDVEDKEQARWVVPHPFRHEAKIIQLNRFDLEEIDNIINTHTQ